MMRQFTCGILLLFATVTAVQAVGTAVAKNTLYRQQIFVDATERDALTQGQKLYGNLLLPKESADELAQWLAKITGKTFTVGDAPKDARAGAIYLLRPASPLATDADRERLKGKGLDAFVLRGSGTHLFIVANDLRGLSYGVYAYLELLGVRWLLAGANWTVVPKRTDVTLTVNRLEAPSYFARSYYGTGGFYSNTMGRGYTGSAASKPTGWSEFQTEWDTWARHMRNGGPGLGHATGEAFVATHVKDLQDHPEYLAKIDGNYSPLFLPARNGDYVLDPATQRYVKAAKAGSGTHELNVIAKLNAGNPEAVDLYCTWILQGLREAEKSPQGYAIRTVSVEPSDGTGEGNNYEELKAQGIGDGSESDQEFYIANYCARKIRAEFPDVSVVMLAYAQRTDPPTFPLEPNFIVQPAFAFRYGKKTAGLSNEDWIALWKTKADTMAVYDYWSIPDWTHDQPDFNYLDLPKKLRYYHDNNIKGINAESTFSGGAIGLSQYLASHLMWKIDTSEKALIDDWYRNAFGPARAPMQRLLERWATAYKPISAELGWSYRDIAEAERLAAGNAAVLARVDDFARYLHYLRLYDELLNIGEGPGKVQKTIDLCEYLFDINDSRMVHTTRIFDLLTQRGNVPAAIAEFHLHGADPNDPPDGPGWARVHPLSHDDVAALIADGLQTYPLPDFEIKTYTGKLVLQKSYAWKAPAGDPWGVSMGVSGAVIDLQMPAGLTAFPLRVSRIEANKITITDDAGHTVYTHAVSKNDADNINKWTWEEMSVPLTPGHYTVNFAGKEGRIGLFYFQSWKGVPLVLRTFQNQKFAPTPRLYFYVPRGLRKIAIYFPYSDQAGGYPTPVYDPNGNRVKVEDHDAGKLMEVTVPAGMDGKIWSLERLVQPYEDFRTLNIPQAFALSPETLMAPADALK